MKLFKNSSVIVLCYLLVSCFDSSAIPWTTEEKEAISSLSLSHLDLQAKAEKNKYANDVKAQAFGEALFFDTRLSQNKKISCATCHQPALNFSDGLEVAQGIKQGSKNTPSIRGAYLNDWQFWDGRKDSLWSQAMGPIEDTKEMGFNRLALAHLINLDESYKQHYVELFGAFPNINNKQRFPTNAGPVSPDKAHRLVKTWEIMAKDDQETINRIFVNTAKAIAAYESTITYPRIALDSFSDDIRKTGKSTKLTRQQQLGLKLFIGKANCIQCHNGPKLSNGGFHQLGIGRGFNVEQGRANVVSRLLNSPFNCLGNYSDAKKNQCNALRFAPITGDEWIGAFKTPSLRNIKNTAPYMHNGLFLNLKEVVDFYDQPAKPIEGHSDLEPLNLTEQEKMDLVEFLQTL